MSYTSNEGNNDEQQLLDLINATSTAKTEKTEKKKVKNKKSTEVTFDMEKPQDSQTFNLKTKKLINADKDLENYDNNVLKSLFVTEDGNEVMK